MNSHYFSKKQTASYEIIPVKFYLKKRKIEISMNSSYGIFSKDKLDRGSNLLINTCLIEDNWKILDMGCGFGPVGISLALFNETIIVDMVDINERAIKICRKNIKEKNLNERVKTFDSDIYEKVKDTDYDSILINPPQTAGKQICNKMIIQAKNHLKDGGILQIVARHQKGGKGFEKLMKETFGNVEVLSRGSGFRIYCSKTIF